MLPASIALQDAAAREPEEVSRLLREPAWIFLRNAEFDVRQGPPAAPAEFGAADGAEETKYWIVQVRGTLGAAARRQLENRGARILSYVPNRAYLVRMEPDAARVLVEEEFATWVGPYRPDYKLAPEIGTRTFSDPERPALPGELLLTLSVFEGEDVGAAADRARALGAEVLAANPHPAAPRILVRVKSGGERALASIDAVEWIEEVGEATLRNDLTRWVAQSNATDFVPVWDAGIHGEDQIIGHIDGGIDRNSCYVRDLIDNTPGPGHRKLVGYRGGFSTDTHGTHTAGTCAGSNTSGSLLHAGLAYQAKISHTRLSLITGFNDGASNLYAYLDSASTDGANVHTNSWGDDGLVSYTTWCRDIDRFSRDREDDLVLFAVTNLATLKTPENAKNCLAVGASRQAPLQDVHGSGGQGPTNDGRRKPEVYLPGVGIVSAATGSCNTTSLSGTSMACPAVAASAALVRQYYEDGYFPSGAANAADAFVPTAALVKATLVNSGRDMSGIAGYPSLREGWGRVLLDDALFFEGDARTAVVKDVRNAGGLETGEFDEFTITAGAGETLRLTLVFTDQPAAVGASFAPVNDLDLEFEGPSGLFLGNFFSAGNSVAGGFADNRNNVERVQLPAGTFTAGEWTVRISATSVPSGPQGYAIHISGDVAESAPPTGIEPTRRAAAAATLLDQNRPNPFVQSTTIRFAVEQRRVLSVSVFDIAGRRIRTLTEGTFDAGEYFATWDARDEKGERVVAGIYFARLEGPRVDLTRKMVLLQ